MAFIAVPTPSSCAPLAVRAVERGKDPTWVWLVAHLTDLLPQNLRLGDHALAVCRFPQCPGEDTDVDLLHAYAHTKVLYPGSKEELVAKEGFDNRG